MTKVELGRASTIAYPMELMIPIFRSTNGWMMNGLPINERMMNKRTKGIEPVFTEIGQDLSSSLSFSLCMFHGRDDVMLTMTMMMTTMTMTMTMMR